MKDAYLEVTYRHGRAVAAYLYLPRQPGDVSHSTRRLPHGLLLDCAADGRPIGIEITAPELVSLANLNAALAEAGLAGLTAADLAPLVRAA